MAKGTIPSRPAIRNTCAAPTTGNNFTLTNDYVEAGVTAAWWNSSAGWEWSYTFSDWLGPKRIQVNPNSQAENAWQSDPYNDYMTAIVVGPDATEHHYTQKERDIESGNDYFGTRYYTSLMGRFMSPDWSAKVEPVPYAKVGDPQSLNLYAFVGNNPLTHVDVDGHDYGQMEAQNAEGNANSAEFVGESQIQHEFIAAATDANGLGELNWGDGGQNSTAERQQKAAAAPAAQQQNVPMSSSTYKTANGAATAALDAVIGQSEKSGWEYAGRIVKLANGKYAYTSPTTEESSTTSDPDGGMKQGTRIPAGTTDAGSYHTHPTSCALCAHDQFGPADNGYSVRDKVPMYMESGATRSIYMLPVRPSILDPTPPTVNRYGPPQ